MPARWERRDRDWREHQLRETYTAAVYDNLAHDVKPRKSLSSSGTDAKLSTRLDSQIWGRRGTTVRARYPCAVPRATSVADRSRSRGREPNEEPVQLERGPPKTRRTRPLGSDRPASDRRRDGGSLNMVRDPRARKTTRLKWLVPLTPSHPCDAR